MADCPRFCEQTRFLVLGSNIRNRVSATDWWRIARDFVEKLGFLSGAPKLETGFLQRIGGGLPEILWRNPVSGPGQQN
ncbi:MAG: hypothetical protein ACRC8Y_06460 [Chroococcales cyanobacterium]